MTQIAWSTAFETGIFEIDNQHRRLVDLNNQLDLQINHEDPAAIRAALEALLDYTKTHFSYEENLLKLAKYSSKELKQHRKKHELFIEKLEQISQQYQQGEAVARRLQILLRNWLLHHIKYEDQDYVPWVEKYLNPQERLLSPAGLFKRLLSA